MPELHVSHTDDARPPSADSRVWDLVVVGGGLAGTAAALEARQIHPEWKILVVEGRRRLGGRAGSFIDPRTGQWVDNCQHVGLGCCKELLRFVDRLGVPNAFRRVDHLQFMTPDRRHDVIRGVGYLPVPLHLLPSFVKLKYLGLWDKLTLGYGVLRLVFSSPQALQGISVKQWLLQKGQTNNSIKRFWEPVLVSALNDSLDRLDCEHARKVFRESFFQSRDGFHLLVPEVPLGVLFDEQVRNCFSSLEIQLKEGLSCAEVGIRNQKFELKLRNGDAFTTQHVILATPWHVTQKIVNLTVSDHWKQISQKIQNLQPSPITGIHLVFDREIVPFSEVALLDTVVQWVFDHTEADRRQAASLMPAGAQSLHLVVSASHALAELKREEILDLAMGELRSAFPEAFHAQLLSSWVVTEHAATFSPSPGVDKFRPSQKTGVPGLALAGDWTETGWPSTMEGAILSGLLAARAFARPE